MTNLSILQNTAARVLDSSIITSKGQITLPKTVRAYLGVSEGQKVRFITDDGKVIVEAQPKTDAQDDPVIGAFLDLIARDIATNPDAIVAIPASLAKLMASLAVGLTADFDETIDGDVAL